jgi:DNA polymerase
MIVGQSPGVQELEEGKPFVGPSGLMLEKLLDLLPMPREYCYITNAVKCHPPGNRELHPREIATCRHYLSVEVREVKPEVLWLIGKAAHRIVRERIPFHHRLPVPTLNPKLLISYHPAYFLRQGREAEWYELAPTLRFLLGMEE